MEVLGLHSRLGESNSGGGPTLWVIPMSGTLEDQCSKALSPPQGAPSHSLPPPSQLEAPWREGGWQDRHGVSATERTLEGASLPTACSSRHPGTSPVGLIPGYLNSSLALLWASIPLN